MNWLSQSRQFQHPERQSPYHIVQDLLSILFPAFQKHFALVPHYHYYVFAQKPRITPLNNQNIFHVPTL